MEEEGWCERGSLDFFCKVEFPRRGEPWQGHSPAREAGRKPRAGVTLPKKGQEDADARFTARMLNSKGAKGNLQRTGIGVSFLTGLGSLSLPPPCLRCCQYGCKQSGGLL